MNNILAIATAFLVFLYICIKIKPSKFYIYAGLVALLGHITVTYTVLPLVPYTWDINDFHSAGITITEGSFPISDGSIGAFSTIQGILYVTFGKDIQIMSVFNGLFAVLLPLPVVYISQSLYINNLEYRNLLISLVLFLPLPFLFFSIPMRDALTNLIVFSIIAIIVYMFKNDNIYMFLPISFAIVAVYLLRPEWGLIIFLGLLSGIILKVYELVDMGKDYLTLLPAFIAVCGTGFLLFVEVLFSLDSVNAEVSYRAGGGAVYLDGMEYHSWFDVVLAGPARGLYFLFAPFPFHVESIFHALALFSSIYVIIFVITSLRSVINCETDNLILIPLIVVFVTGIVGYGIINSNFGTNVRHRTPFVFMLIIFSGPVIQKWELEVSRWFSQRPDDEGSNNKQ